MLNIISSTGQIAAPTSRRSGIILSRIWRYGITWILVGALGAFLVAKILPSFISRTNWRLYIVQSGSMEPSVGVGDLIVITPKSVYQKGDVIAFTQPDGRRVTHRIVEVNSREDQQNNQQIILVSYVTKGDANPAPDPDPVTPAQIEGYVDMVFPHLGYLLSFGKTRKGMVILILVPAVLLIADEVINIRSLFGYRTGRRRVIT